MNRFMSFVAAITLLTSCGGGGGNDVKLTYGEVVASGWVLYQAADFDSAYVVFGEALDEFGLLPADSLARAHAGRGWALGKMGNYSGALTEFSQAGSNHDAMAGLCFTYLAQNSFSSTTTACLNLISANASYVFTYEPSITITDVRIALGQAYFYTNNYSGVIAQLDVLSPGHGLTASSPPADLLAKLMQLRNAG